MFMQEQCEECFLNQLPDLFDLYEVKDSDRELLTGLVKGIVCDPENQRLSPPETAEKVYEELTLRTGMNDPYAEIKRTNNAEMADLYPLLKLKIWESGSPLLTAIKFATIANSIDYGIAGHSFDLDKLVEEAENLEFAIDDTDLFLRSLDMSDSLLYILDNAGEAVADLLCIETIRKVFPALDVCVAVRGKPVINDVDADDLRQLNPDKSIHIVDTGRRLPGIPRKGGEHFEKAFMYYDLILAKGQGNFETNRDDRRVFHLFRVKCDVVSGYLNVPVGGAVFYEKL